MVVVGQPDKQKALSLKGMAKITLERLESTDKARYASNTLTDYYDIIHKLLEAMSALDGIKIKGDGAQQSLSIMFAESMGSARQQEYFCRRSEITEIGYPTKDLQFRKSLLSRIRKGLKRLLVSC